MNKQKIVAPYDPPWTITEAEVANVLQSGTHPEILIEKVNQDGTREEICTLYPKGDTENKEILMATAKLIKLAPVMKYLLKEILDARCPCCDNSCCTRQSNEEYGCFFESYSDANKCVYDDIFSILEDVKYFGETAVMTSEQIKACTNYLDTLDILRQISETGGDTWAWDAKRKQYHEELLKVYGFQYESDTWRVTSDIEPGTTARQLHDRLMELKRLKEKK